MKLRHYSATRFPRIDTTKWGDQRPDMKPVGLWVSDDADEECSWPAWCRAEDFRLGNLRFQYRATLHPKGNVLVLRSAFEIDAFTEEFGIDASWSMGDRKYHIDWPRVASLRSGIIITPYQLSRRHEGHSPWYYGWDCASGCIWDISAFESFEFEADLGALLEAPAS